jgi:hypothetical protein
MLYNVSAAVQEHPRVRPREKQDIYHCPGDTCTNTQVQVKQPGL